MFVVLPASGALVGALLAVLIRRAAIRRAFAEGQADGRRAVAGHALVGGVVGLLLQALVLVLMFFYVDLSGGSSASAAGPWAVWVRLLPPLAVAGVALGPLAALAAAVVDWLYGEAPTRIRRLLVRRLLLWPPAGGVLMVVFALASSVLAILLVSLIAGALDA